jgi:hypothetical protein
MAALLGMREAALAAGPAGAGVARSVASIASALAQRDTEVVCGTSSSCSASTAAAANGSPAGLANGHAAAAAAAVAAGAPANPSVLPLAGLMLQLVSRPERAVCEAAVDYFLMVNTLPAVQRPLQLVQPLFASLIPPLLRGHACYPPTFTNWLEDLDDDEEEFYRWGGVNQPAVVVTRVALQLTMQAAGQGVHLQHQHQIRALKPAGFCVLLCVLLCVSRLTFGNPICCSCRKQRNAGCCSVWCVCTGSASKG